MYARRLQFHLQIFLVVTACLAACPASHGQEPLDRGNEPASRFSVTQVERIGATRFRPGLEFLSDTSLEIFPKGRAVWTHPARNTTTVVVSIDVVDVGRTNASLRGEKLLCYCFISQSPGRENRMAHGRTWSGPAGELFVQHTPAKPITADFVHDISLSTMKRAVK